MGHEYGAQKLMEATLALAAGEGTIKPRLAAACKVLVPVEAAEDIPGDLRNQFEHIRRKATGVDPEVRSEGAIDASVRAMDEDEAVYVARQIVDMSYLIRAYGDE